MLNLEEIKNRVELTDVLTRYGVKLNKDNFACCPFHSEKTPSFRVYGDRKKYHCFGCGKGGDVITFVMDYFNVEFKEALKILDNEYGLELFKKMSPKEHYKMKSMELMRKQEAEKKKKEHEYDMYAYDRLCSFRRWLLTEPQNGITQHHIACIDYKLDNFDIHKKSFEKDIDKTIKTEYMFYKIEKEKYMSFQKEVRIR